MAAFKKIGKLLYILIVLAVVVSVPVSAKTSYQTYTYSYAGDVQISPNAYTPVYELFDFGMETPLNKPQDMAADAEDRIAIADTGNSRIVILNNQLKSISGSTAIRLLLMNPKVFLYAVTACFMWLIQVMPI